MAQIQDHYPDLTELEGLLDAARMHAANDWEEQFVADMQERYEQYGKRGFLSDAQKQQLERIANDQ